MSKSESEATDKVGNETKDMTDRNENVNVKKDDEKRRRPPKVEKEKEQLGITMGLQKRFPASRLCCSQVGLATSIAQALQKPDLVGEKHTQRT